MTAQIVKLSDYRRSGRPLSTRKEDADTDNKSSFASYVGYAFLGLASLLLVQRLCTPRTHH